jgi:hypothetical protein
MVTLKTFGDLLRHGYLLHGHCRACERHEVIELAACPVDRSYIGARFRCRDCRGIVGVTLSKAVVAGDDHLPALERWRQG